MNEDEFANLQKFIMNELKKISVNTYVHRNKIVSRDIPRSTISARAACNFRYKFSEIHKSVHLCLSELQKNGFIDIYKFYYVKSQKRICTEMIHLMKYRCNPIGTRIPMSPNFTYYNRS